MTRTILAVAASLLLVAFFWRQGERVLDANGPTFDEGVHLAAGYSYWTTGRFRLNAEDPPLLKLWWTLPLALSGGTDELRTAVADPGGDQWHAANAFLYESRVPHRDLLTPARRMNLAVGCGVVLLAGWWSFRLWGSRLAGVGAAAFAAFDPNLLALACVLSTDCGLAFFGMLAAYCLWEYSARPTRGWLIATGVSLGLLLGSKFSAIATVGGLGLASLLHMARGGTLALPGKPGGVRGAFDLAIRLGVIALIALAALYGFAEFNEWGRGLKFQLTRGHQGDTRLYLLGEHSSNGWLHYFLVATGVKLPLGLLIASGIGLVSIAFGKRDPRLAFLLVPSLIFFLAVSYSRVNLGIRAVLPATVFLYVIAGRGLACSGFGRVVPIACLVWSGFAAGSAFPLSYFNEIAQGRGHEFLADSNLDWGQGLPALRDHMREENLDAVYLSYFGTDRPEAYGIRYHALPGSGRIGPPGGEPIPENAPRHVLAISANNLIGLYLKDRDTFDFLRRRRPDRILAGSILIFDITHDAEALRRVRMMSP
ncbi:MAG: phospholipid carrier-dependent glycosyltransferase [Gemmataceae bacterium]